MRTKKALFLIPIFLTALFLLLGVPSSAKAAIVNGSTIAKGVKLGEVDLGGKTLEEASQAVEDYCQQIADSSFTVNVFDDSAGTPQLVGSYSVTLRDLGFQWSAEASLKKATTFGQKGRLIELYKNLQDLAHEQVILPLECSVKAEAIRSFIEDKVAASANRPVQDAKYALEGGTLVLANAGQNGIEVDVAATAEAMFSCFQNGLPQTFSCDAIVNVTKSANAGKDWSNITFTLLGECTTYVNVDEDHADRNKNVARGMSLINGSILMPGETLSVCDCVVPVGPENGFYLAGTFSGGRVIKAWGGGLCQVSTTICNAVMQAELEIIRRDAHSMVVDYIPASLDAAVNEIKSANGNYGKDFVFRNNTDAPIYLETFMEGDHVTAKVYGHETRPYTYKNVSFKSVIIQQDIINPTYVFVTDKNPSKPYEEGAYLPHTKSESYLVVTYNGKTTETPINKDEYQKTSLYKIYINCNMLGLYTQPGGNGRDLIYDRNGNLLLTDDHGVPYYENGSYLLAKDYVCDKYGIAHTPGGKPQKKNPTPTTPAETTPAPTTTPEETTTIPDETTVHVHEFTVASVIDNYTEEDANYIYTYKITKYNACSCGETKADEKVLIAQDPKQTETTPSEHEHQWSAWYPNNNGTHSRTCSAPGCPENAQTESCNYTSAVTKEPTCTEAGIRTYTCTVCGQWTEEIPATGHQYNGEVTTSASCTEAGVMTYTCGKCGDNYTEPIPATGHQYPSDPAPYKELVECGDTYIVIKTVKPHSACEKCGYQPDDEVSTNRIDIESGVTSARETRDLVKSLGLNWWIRGENGQNVSELIDLDKTKIEKIDARALADNIAASVVIYVVESIYLEQPSGN